MQLIYIFLYSMEKHRMVMSTLGHISNLKILFYLTYGKYHQYKKHSLLEIS